VSLLTGGFGFWCETCSAALLLLDVLCGAARRYNSDAGAASEFIRARKAAIEEAGLGKEDHARCRAPPPSY